MPNFAQAFCNMLENFNLVMNNKETCDATAVSLFATYKEDLQNWWQKTYLDKDTGKNVDKYTGDASKMNGALSYVQSTLDVANDNVNQDPSNQQLLFSLGQSVLGINGN